MTQPTISMTAVALLCPFLLGLAPALDAQKYLRDQTALLRKSPKHFGSVVRLDSARRRIEMHIEGEKDSRWLHLEPDAEVKIHGTWGEFEQLVPQDRAWIWMHPEKPGRPGRVFVIADELSEQQLHGLPWEVKSVDTKNRKVDLRRSYGKKMQLERRIEMDDSLTVRSEGDLAIFEARDRTVVPQPETTVKPGDRVFVQTSASRIRLLLKPDGFANLMKAQRERLHVTFRNTGLPATVANNHPFAGEIEIMIDHEGMRWARHQVPGVEVALQGNPAAEHRVRGVLRLVEGWHEKTRFRVVTRGEDLADIRPGQRIRVRVEEPPADVLASEFPSGGGRAKTVADRVAWVLANTYCACSIAGDGCTGMFYTLASCNPKSCGMPKRVTTLVEEKIAAGKTDAEIVAELRKDRGPMCLRPHLLR